MSGSSLDGLDLVFASFDVSGSSWTYEILAADCYPYPPEWLQRLETATALPAGDYQQLHCDYGRYLGEQVNRFVETYQLHYKVQLVGSHGHTTFHRPESGMTHQLGDGAALAATCGINVVSDLRSMDVALGGQGAPIVPIGEKWLLGDFSWFLNIGGIANLSRNGDPYMAFDVCPANRVLNLLAATTGQPYDAGGATARSGQVHPGLLEQLSQLPYYRQSPPKSLANSFGTDVVFPLLQTADLSAADSLCTYTEHIAQQVQQAIQVLPPVDGPARLLVTGGGAFNTYLLERMRSLVPELELVVPDEQLVQYKEALIMAFMAVLRWREENNVWHTVTGARRSSVGGAIWMGQDW